MKIKWIALLGVIALLNACSERSNVPGEKERTPSESNRNSKSQLA